MLIIIMIILCAFLKTSEQKHFFLVNQARKSIRFWFRKLLISNISLLLSKS